MSTERTETPSDPQPERLICHACGQRFWVQPGEAWTCRECGGRLRHFGPLEGLVERFLAPDDLVDSRLYRYHLRMVEVLWTRDNRGREFYEILRPKMSYGRFEKLVTELVCEALREGWAELRLPAAPVPSDDAYELVFTDQERFVAELMRRFESR